MMNFTTAKIAKRANAESDSHFLTFNLWVKGDKHRVYINDYKRRTIGYIDLDNNNALVVNDRQGNTQDEIDYAVAAFFTDEYITIDEQTSNDSDVAETEDSVKASKIKAELIERTDLFKKKETRDKAVKLVNEATYPAEWWIDNEDILLCCKLADAMRCVQHGSVELKPYRDFSVPSAHN